MMEDYRLFSEVGFKKHLIKSGSGATMFVTFRKKLIHRH